MPARWSLLAFAVALAVVLSACVSGSQPRIDRDDVVGEWTHAESSEISTINLGEDNVVAIENLPRRVLGPTSNDDDLDWTDTVDVAGTWSWDRETQVVTLSLETSPDNNIVQQKLRVQFVGNVAQLYMSVDTDRDIRFAFENARS